MRLCAIYDPSVPGYRDLFDALSRQVEVTALSPLEWGALRDRRNTVLLRPIFIPVWPGAQPWRAWSHGALARRLGADCQAVIFTRPDQEPLLNSFPSATRIYLVNDDFSQYGRNWLAEEVTLLQSVDLIFAVSRSLAELLAVRAGAASPHIAVLPNALPALQVPPQPPTGPATMPSDIRTTGRPLAGVLGRISSRLRLDWLQQAIEATPWLHWVFAGDIEEGELLEQDRPIIEWLKQHPRCAITGRLPYDRMAEIADALEVAVMPYSERSTNSHGSPMRLFLHLPRFAPILATPGCRQSAEYAPWVRCCADPAALIAALEELRGRGFDDGQRETRWRESAQHTWDARARLLLDHLTSIPSTHHTKRP